MVSPTAPLSHCGPANRPLFVCQGRMEQAERMLHIPLGTSASTRPKRLPSAPFYPASREWRLSEESTSWVEGFRILSSIPEKISEFAGEQFQIYHTKMTKISAASSKQNQQRKPQAS